MELQIPKQSGTSNGAILTSWSQNLSYLSKELFNSFIDWQKDKYFKYRNGHHNGNANQMQNHTKKGKTIERKKCKFEFSSEDEQQHRKKDRVKSDPRRSRKQNGNKENDEPPITGKGYDDDSDLNSIDSSTLRNQRRNIVRVARSQRGSAMPTLSAGKSASSG